jgi:ketosteroid isomerase-like protein
VGANEGFQVVHEVLAAVAAADAPRAAELYNETAIMRMAGVPRSFGGVVEGREAIVRDIAQRAPTTLDVRLVFGDDTHVCAVAKRTGTLTATQTFRGNDESFSTYECVVFRLEDGRIAEQTTYVNWLDAYVQTGVLDLAALLD